MSNLYRKFDYQLYSCFRSSASPISQLPPFLLAAMGSGSNNTSGGPKLDALLRQVNNGPPSKKAKVRHYFLNL